MKDVYAAGGKIYHADSIDYVPTHFDIDGHSVTKSKKDYPYSYDTFVLWKSGDFEKGKNQVVYSDRLFQWDPQKYNESSNRVWGDNSQYFTYRTPNETEEFLSLYYGRPIILTAVAEGCNISNGYPFWVFYFEDK